MDFVKAITTITGIAPLSQSHQHVEEKLEGESHDAYDARTWGSKLNVEQIGGKPQVIIPAFGLHMAIMEGAKYSKKQIAGQGKATWTAKFRSGISIMGPIGLGISPAEVKPIVLSVNADGVRGSGKRVIRRFPQIPSGWSATFETIILDPIITQDIWTEMMELAGLFIGVGQFRPQNGGSNGRFTVDHVEWTDARRKISRPVAKAA